MISEAIPILLLDLLLAAALAGGPATHGRFVLSAETGGGWASDAFLGAGLGAGPFAQLAPGARVDLSLGPRVKLAAGAGLSFGRFGAGPFSFASQAAGVEARFLPGKADFEAGVALAGERSTFSAPAPLAGTASGTGVTRTAAALVTPSVRLRRRSITWRGTLTGAARSSRVGGEDVGERGLAAQAGGEWTARPWLRLDLAAYHERTASDRPDFARIATSGAAGAAAWPLGEAGPGLALAISVQRTRFDTGVRETLARASVDASQPVGPVEALLSISSSRSVEDGADLPSSHRQVVFLGVRGRARVLGW